MRASNIFFATLAPVLVLACGGSTTPDVGNGTSSDGNENSTGSSSGSSGNKNSGSDSSSTGSSSGSSSSGSSGSSSSSSSGSSSSVKRVFVTSTTFAGDFGGTSGADAKCQLAADSQVLGGSWKAWISSGSVNAIDRINDVGPWYLVDRITKVFNNKANLLTIPLANITLDELGQQPTWFGYSTVWTGTNESGDDSGWDCNAFTSALSTDSATIGTAGMNQEWGGTSDAPVDCDVSNALVCFEQ